MTNKKTQWRQQLATSRQHLLRVLDQLSPEQWQTVVYSEGNTWSVRDIVSHLVDSENGMSIHIYKIRKGRETVPENFDLNRWNAGVKKRTGDISNSELRQQLDSVRAKLLEGLDTLQDHEWALTGRHPFRGVITIEQYYQTISGHESTHAADIEKATGLKD